MDPQDHDVDVRKALDLQFRKDTVQRAERMAAQAGDNSAGQWQGPPTVGQVLGGLTVARADSICREVSDPAVNDLLVACAVPTVRAQLRVGKDRGKRGWHDPCLCNTHVLVAQLEHATQKKDWASVATYAMMLHVRAVNHWN